MAPSPDDIKVAFSRLAGERDGSRSCRATEMVVGIDAGRGERAAAGRDDLGILSAHAVDGQRARSGKMRAPQLGRGQEQIARRCLIALAALEWRWLQANGEDAPRRH